MLIRITYNKIDTNTSLFVGRNLLNLHKYQCLHVNVFAYIFCVSNSNRTYKNTCIYILRTPVYVCMYVGVYTYAYTNKSLLATY